MDAYDKGATLGQGTFGVVYKATHKEVRERAVCWRGGTRWLFSFASIKKTLNLARPFLHTIHPKQTGKVVAVKKIRLGNAKEVCACG